MGYNILECSQFGKSENNTKKSKKVINTETGVIYNSAKEAAIIEGVKRTTLTSYLRGEMHNKTKLKYLC